MRVFNFTVFEAAVADRDAVRYTDQFPLSEHYAGAQSSIVKNDINTGLFQAAVQFIGNLLNFFALVVKGAMLSGQIMPLSS